MAGIDVRRDGGSLRYVLEVLDEENPVTNINVSIHILQICRVEREWSSGWRLMSVAVEAGRGRAGNPHIPICFGGELPAHSQDKGGPETGMNKMSK